MMKIGIVTLDDFSNFGNRLQNYAVCNILKDHRCSAETIIIKTKEEALSNSKNAIKKAAGRVLPAGIFFKIFPFSNIVKYIEGDLKAKRWLIFYKFSISRIPRKVFYLNKYEDIKKSSFKMYDFVFVGSNQVWNPDFAGSDYYFLTFVPPKKGSDLYRCLMYKQSSRSSG